MRTLVNERTAPRIKPRPAVSHKGTFGTLAALVGSPSMTGAALLSCESALRSGVGLLKIFADNEVLAVVRTVLPEAICLPPEDIAACSADAFLFGCGLGRSKDALLERALPHLQKPAVIDADGINFLSAHKDILKNMPNEKILTPHPGEMSRLTGLSLSQIAANREGLAASFASEYNCILVLKGHETVTATPDGDVFVNTTGGSGLAKGGSGDVLAGVIASLCAGGYTPADAAVLGVYLHGLAGDELEKELGASGMLPSDVCRRIGLLLG